MLSVALAQPAVAQGNAPDTRGAQQPAQAPVNDGADQTQPSAAADAAASPVSTVPQEVAAGQDIVVTGSRIARKDYDSTSPIVTVDQQLFEQSSTAALEQNLNKLPQFTPAKTPTGSGDIQPTATNTPGSATISLRGLGTNRNLVLVDGRRATPSTASGVVNINTIPSAAIERVEIISGGASATYGADAVAGVTNFILKKNFKGVELDGSTAISEVGDGFEWQLSGIMGTDFDDGRGNVSIAMSVNTREKSYQRNRKWYKNAWENPNLTIGARTAFPLAPGVALGLGNPPSDAVFYGQLFPGTTRFGNGGLSSPAGANGQPTANTIYSGLGGANAGPQNFTVYVNPNGSLFTLSSLTSNFNQQGGTRFYGGQTYQSEFGSDFFRTKANNALYEIDPSNINVLPLTRYNMFMRGNYELNDWISIFGQGLYSTTKTFTTGAGGAITSGWDVFIPYGTGVYTGSANPDTAYGSYGNPSSVILNGMTFNGAAYVDPTPAILGDNPTNPAFATKYRAQYACAAAAIGGCTNNQVLGSQLPAQLQTLLNSRVNPNGRVELNYGFPPNRSVTSNVSTYTMIGGFQGKVPGTDITWELFGSRGQTSTFTRTTGTISLSRLRTLLDSPGFGKGFSTNSNTASARPAFGATFATCTTGMNIFTMAWNQISQDCKNAITADLKNNSEVTQSIAEFNAQGTLFNLPAGELKAAVGASYRQLKYQFRNDTITSQGESFLDQVIGIYPSADVAGRYSVRELYGELLVPILKDIPLIRSLNLELGGRVSDYNTTGKSYTYKILGDWELTNWLRARGGYNRAERSPNIAELFQAPSEIFGTNTLGDLCQPNATYRISANPARSTIAADVRATCAAVMDRTAGAGQGALYYARDISTFPVAGSVSAFTNAVGNPNLKPEKADTFTAGVVVQSPFETPLLRRLRFTVDWYQIKIKNTIGLQSAGIALQQCLDPTYNTAVTGAAGSAAQAQAAANNVYCAGIRYEPSPIYGPANFDVTYFNNGRVEVSGIDGQVDYAADVGPGTFNLNFLINYYLHFKSRELSTNPLVDYAGTLGTAQNGLNAGAFRYRMLTTVGYGLGPARLSLQWQHLPSVKQEAAAIAATTIGGYPSYDLFNLNGSFAVNRDVTFRFGVDNLLNKAPPLGGVNSAPNTVAGQLPGGSFNATQYDVIGRRFYLGATAKF